MTSQKPPFRADHVGSLLRPAALRHAFKQFDQGEIDAAQFRAVQDDSIRAVVRLQEEVGLQSITDGEFRRVSYWAHFVEKVAGLGVKTAVFTFHDDNQQEQNFLCPHVEGRVERTQPISGDEFDFLRQTTRQTPKTTLPSPPTMHFWRGQQGIDPAAYADPDAFFADLAAVYRAEIADLVARGSTYIQLDEVPLAMLCDPRVREQLRAAGSDPDQLVNSYVKLINDALAERPSTLTVAMHLCRGNYKGKWLSEGGYGYVAEKLFNDINVDAFFLEYDTPRAGDFTPLSLFPRGKTAVLGLISSKTPQLEPLDDLRRRLDEASRHVPLEQLAVSPQCGFASTVAGNPVTEDDQRRKLALVVELAERVWGAE